MSKNRGRIIEDIILKYLKAKPHLNSGAMKEKWDGHNKDLLIEVKSTKSEQFTIKKGYLESLLKDSYKTGKNSVLVHVFDDDENEIDMENVYATVPLNDYLNCLVLISRGGGDDYDLEGVLNV